jgi:hypothetical protein
MPQSEDDEAAPHATATQVDADPAGLAFLSVAQTSAIAVQDAADHLRQVSTLGTTAAGAALAQFLATGDPKYLQAVAVAQGMVRSATEDFRTVGLAAAEMLQRFPAGRRRP